MVEEALHDVLRSTLYNAEKGVRSVVFNALKHVMLDLLHKDVIGEALNAHTADAFSTDEASEGL